MVAERKRGKWVANLDMYRKVPVDLLEGTKSGSILSWCALLVIFTLFFKETQEFMQSTLVTDLALDSETEDNVKVNFNITMLDLKCEFATIDVFSAVGKQQNVTKNINKWTVDAEGIARQFIHRNTEQEDIDLHDEKVTSTLEEMHQNGEDAISLDPTTFEFAMAEYQFLFVEFYASWCSHCRFLAPTWETLANVMVDASSQIVNDHAGIHNYTDEEYEQAIDLNMPVFIGKIDCVDHKNLCMDQAIRGYPTLRLFVEGKPYNHGDYNGDRTVMGMTEFLAVAEDNYKKEHGDEDSRNMDLAREYMKEKMNATEEERKWAENMERIRHNNANAKWIASDHPGCQISGELLINRSPGNFYVRAQSKSHDLAPHMTNVSHIVHHLSFGAANMINHLNKEERSTKIEFPEKFIKSLQPMEEHVYITKDLHEAHHHYLKLVPTNLTNHVARNSDQKSMWKAVKHANIYQVLQSSELAFYRDDVVPEAKFLIDFSPIAVSYRVVGREWYDYLTSIMAIIGGTFTVLGFLEASIRKVVKKSRKNVAGQAY